jgi:rhodanese-related sulfurtransferase
VEFITQNWMLITIAVLSAGMLAWPSVSQGGGAMAVSPTQAVQLINRERATLIDITSDDEYRAAHAKGAKHVPADDLEKALGKIVKDKGRPVVIMCATGARSRGAAARARKAGYTRALSLAGGLGAWRQANMPVETQNA